MISIVYYKLNSFLNFTKCMANGISIILRYDSCIWWCCRLLFLLRLLLDFFFFNFLPLLLILFLLFFSQSWFTAFLLFKICFALTPYIIRTTQEAWFVLISFLVCYRNCCSNYLFLYFFFHTLPLYTNQFRPQNACTHHVQATKFSIGGYAYILFHHHQFCHQLLRTNMHYILTTFWYFFKLLDFFFIVRPDFQFSQEVKIFRP